MNLNLIAIFSGEFTSTRLAFVKVEWFEFGTRYPHEKRNVRFFLLGKLYKIK